MKKLLMVLLIAALAATAVGCSSNDASNSSSNNNTPTNVSTTAPSNKYNDGTFLAYSDATDKGYGWAEVTIKDDKITEVKLGETNGFGDEKPEDYRYAEFHEAKAAMPAKFVEANGSKVDIFTAATSSSNKWMQAVERALDKALVENSNKAKYNDGIFLGASEATERGRGVVLVTVKDDKIVEVVLQETTFTKDEQPKEVFKGEDYAYAEFHSAKEAMPAKFVEANGSKVDIFTGATSSSNKWMAAVEQALQRGQR